MAKDPSILEFLDAKSDTIDNLKAILTNLTRCVDDGMVDLESSYYNSLLTLLDEASLSETWDEIEEVIAKAKTLEIDVAVWLSSHGQTSVSLPWPKAPKRKQS
ncbi:MAG: hypothetical protein COT85_02425 [Chlamydiae bacterium CG10_big_fil_rev_8_21_14_0_10_42_34]|nr:MAG: hypothetical protein COT85_02425 [Chlamydiae bacterium CG10_big_fil_rev_8_21_14_0_10_42_34]